VPHHGISEAMLTIDGQRHWVITADDRIVLEACPTRLQLASSSSHLYFSRLRQKLAWSGAFPPDARE
jgi:NAD kinase